MQNLKYCYFDQNIFAFGKNNNQYIILSYFETFYIF